MLIHRIKLQNVLSFGPEAQELELKPLNVLIGPNGSGKSNLIEAISLLQAAPRELSTPIREGGGVSDWIWRGPHKQVSTAQLEAVIVSNSSELPLRYSLSFAELGQSMQVVGEKLEDNQSDHGADEPWAYFSTNSGFVDVRRRIGDGGISVTPLGVQPGQSLFSHLKDPSNHPEITDVGDQFGRICFYREWTFGRQTQAHRPQKTDLPNNLLSEDLGNLGLVLNRMTRDLSVKKKIVECLREIYDGVDDFFVNIEYGTVQVYLREGGITLPATRLSDGTIRYLCILVILCNPDPPPLICIEEPELGLHPDILPRIAELLREASERCQLIVTTHSDVLVDALTDTPDSIVVCEKHKGRTSLKRLDKDKLATWLEKYRLGELWTSGEIGGNRW